MKTIEAKILLVRETEEHNTIGYKSLQVIALHYNNGYVVGCTALTGGGIADFHGQDFEVLETCYNWINEAF